MRVLGLLAAGILACVSLSVMAEEAPPAFTLNTNAFLDTGPIPVMYTCDGKDVSPQLDWTNLPPKTQSLALLITDPDAPGGTFYHWVVYNIPTKVTNLDEASQKLPAGAVVGKNSFGKLQYNGPCPPKGAVHTYAIDLYALDSTLSLPAGAEGKAVIADIKKHTVGKAELTLVYSRWLK